MTAERAEAALLRLQALDQEAAEGWKAGYDANAVQATAQAALEDISGYLAGAPAGFQAAVRRRFVRALTEGGVT